MPIGISLVITVNAIFALVLALGLFLVARRYKQLSDAIIKTEKIRQEYYRRKQELDVPSLQKTNKPVRLK